MSRRNLIAILLTSLALVLAGSAFGQPNKQKTKAGKPTAASSSQKTNVTKAKIQTPNGQNNSSNKNSFYTNSLGEGLLGVKNPANAKNSAQTNSNQPNGKTKIKKHSRLTDNGDGAERDEQTESELEEPLYVRQNPNGSSRKKQKRPQKNKIP